MWRGGLREGEGEYRFSHGDRDGSGVIEDDECDCYRCGASTHMHARTQAFTHAHTHTLTGESGRMTCSMVWACTSTWKATCTRPHP